MDNVHTLPTAFSVQFQSCVLLCQKGRLALIIDNKHYINAIKLHCHLLVLDGIYVTICWTSDDCDGQVDLKLHLSVGQVILFPYFDHCTGQCQCHRQVSLLAPLK